MARTLQQLKESIEKLISQQGPDAPVAAYIFTQEDVVEYFIDDFVMNEEGEQVTQPLEIAEEVLNNLDEYDYLYEEVFNCIDNELRQLKVLTD